VTTEHLTRISYWVERWVAGATSATQAVQEIRKITLEAVSATVLVEATQGLSAERLAIALMAQARETHRLANATTDPGTEKWLRSNGDRLAEWASTARQLGVEQAKSDQKNYLLAVEVDRLQQILSGLHDWATNRGWPQPGGELHEILKKLSEAFNGQ